MDRYYGRRQSDSHIYPPSRQLRQAPTGILGPMLERRETQQSLQDAGGLLSSVPESQSRTLQPILSGGSSNGSPLPRVANARLGNPDDFELEDLGGLLSSDRQPDASAAALERAHRRSAPQAIQTPPPPTPAANSQAAGWDSMDIHDPGGLLGK